MDQQNTSSTIAYMKRAGGLPMVVKPTIGLTAHKGIDNELNLNDNAIGDLQAEALGAAIRYAKQDKIYACNNRLTGEGAFHIIDSITSLVKEINLSDNDLTAAAKRVETNMIDYLEDKEMQRKDRLERFKSLQKGIRDSTSTDETRNSTDMMVSRTQKKSTQLKLDSLMSDKKRPSQTAMSLVDDFVSPSGKNSRVSDMVKLRASLTNVAEET